MLVVGAPVGFAAVGAGTAGLMLANGGRGSPGSESVFGGSSKGIVVGLAGGGGKFTSLAIGGGAMVTDGKLLGGVLAAAGVLGGIDWIGATGGFGKGGKDPYGD